MGIGVGQEFRSYLAGARLSMCKLLRHWQQHAGLSELRQPFFRGSDTSVCFCWMSRRSIARSMIGLRSCAYMGMHLQLMRDVPAHRMSIVQRSGCLTHIQPVNHGGSRPVCTRKDVLENGLTHGSVWKMLQGAQERKQFQHCLAHRPTFGSSSRAAFAWTFELVLRTVNGGSRLWA